MVMVSVPCQNSNSRGPTSVVFGGWFDYSIAIMLHTAVKSVCNFMRNLKLAHILVKDFHPQFPPFNDVVQ